MPTAMSMIARAPSPGTAVLPICSRRRGRSSHACAIRSASAAYSSGQSGSYGTSNTSQRDECLAGVLRRARDAHDAKQLGARHVQHHLELAGVEPDAAARAADVDFHIQEFAFFEIGLIPRTFRPRLSRLPLLALGVEL